MTRMRQLGWVIAVVVAPLAAAEEPKASPKVPDLAPLRDAVTAAARKGENVTDVQAALAALEKRLTKGAPDEPLDELFALRTAVEAAARKGEKVEDVLARLKEVEAALLRLKGAPDAAFVKARDAYLEAFYAGDTKAMAQAESDDFVVFHDRAPDLQKAKPWRDDIAALVAAKTWSPRRVADTAEVVVRTSGPVTVVTGIGPLVGPGPRGSRSFSEVWTKADERWKIRTLHYDFRPDDKAPKK